tara:strand:- start:105 stop:374 length:270 start_codon:yes stop_codon:yes gene_type:complete
MRFFGRCYKLRDLLAYLSVLLCIYQRRYEPDPLRSIGKRPSTSSGQAPTSSIRASCFGGNINLNSLAVLGVSLAVIENSATDKELAWQE